MPEEPFQISISEETVDVFEEKLGAQRQFGADFRFLGVVREGEEGRTISGIRYTCYQPMAEQKLAELCRETLETHPDHRVLIHHRIGLVPAGEPSIVIRVQTKHSKEGFSLCQDYLAKIKTSVPIWKDPQFVD